MKKRDYYILVLLIALVSYAAVNHSQHCSGKENNKSTDQIISKSQQSNIMQLTQEPALKDSVAVTEEEL